ncbi:MAG: hypothetical protein ACI9YO_002890, partial [Gammaproteobacteria bacterium]
LLVIWDHFWWRHFIGFRDIFVRTWRKSLN